MGLLMNPVIQGLLSGGPNAIRAQAEAQRAALAPRGGGGMMGAPSPIVTQDRSMSELGQGLAGLGQGIGAIGQMVQHGKQREAEDAVIQQYVGGIQDPAQRERVMTMAATPDGRQFLMQGLAKQAFPDAGQPPEFQNIANPKTGDMRPHQKGLPLPEGFVLAGTYSPPKDGPADKIKLWFGDKSVDVTPGTATEDYYLKSGYKRTPTLRDGNEDSSFKNERDLRTEVIALNKDFRGVVDQFGRVESAVTKPSPANDIALVFSYMKMLDPTSVVREGEQATVQNAGGVPERVRAQWNRLQSGEKFTEDLRRDFYQSARELYERKNTDYQRDLGYYRDLATRNKLDPSNVVLDIYRSPTGIPDAPPPNQGAPLGTTDQQPGRAPGAAEAAPSLTPEMSAFKTLSPARQAGALATLPEDQHGAYLDALDQAQLKALANELRRRSQ